MALLAFDRHRREIGELPVCTRAHRQRSCRQHSCRVSDGVTRLSSRSRVDDRRKTPLRVFTCRRRFPILSAIGSSSKKKRRGCVMSVADLLAPLHQPHCSISSNCESLIPGTLSSLGQVGRVGWPGVWPFRSSLVRPPQTDALGRSPRGRGLAGLPVGPRRQPGGAPLPTGTGDPARLPALPAGAGHCSGGTGVAPLGQEFGDSW